MKLQHCKPTIFNKKFFKKNYFPFIQNKKCLEVKLQENLILQVDKQSRKCQKKSQMGILAKKTFIANNLSSLFYTYPSKEC